MPKLTRIRSGKVYRTDFDAESLDNFWQVSPSGDTPENYYSLKDRPGWLRMKQTDEMEPTRILFDIPPSLSSFVLEIANEYHPQTVGNQGGLTAFQEIKNKIELLEYFDGATDTTINYTHMRIRRFGNTYEGYGSKDNGATWTLIGAKTSKEMEKIGFVLYGDKSTEDEPLDIDYACLYRDTHIHAQNLKPGMVVKVFDSFGRVVGQRECLDGEDSVRVPVMSRLTPFEGFVRLIDATGTFVNDTPMIDIWGGDIFWNGVYLDFFIDDTRLKVEEDWDLGNMEDGVIELPVEVENPSEFYARNIILEVRPYYYYFGHKWVQIAQDSFGTPSDYKKRIWLGDIAPNERHFFWLRIRRVPAEQEAQYHPYKFRVLAYNEDEGPPLIHGTPDLITSFTMGEADLTTNFRLGPDLTTTFSVESPTTLITSFTI